jgi:GNAT superfamily N-acetyltransferase
MEDLLDRSRSAWAGLAGLDAGFTSGRMTLGVSPDSAICPAGWTGIVVLGDAAIVTTPDQATARRCRALADVPVRDLTDPLVISGAVGVDQVLGPAELAFVDAQRFRPAHADVEMLPAGDPGIGALLDSASPAEAGESGIAEITSAACVLRSRDEVLAVSGYRTWPGDIAHLSVLTHPAHRGRGLAKYVASAAVAGALSDGLLPQWRARVPASIRLAASLGFATLGSQFSVHIDAADSR